MQTLWKLKPIMASFLRVSVAVVCAMVLAASTAVAATFVVSNTNDSGPGSLRQAILGANASFGADATVFAIPAGGVQTITLATQLPALTDDAGVTIDGFSQPGASANTLGVGDNAVRLIRIIGPTFLTAIGIASGNNTIRGITITGGVVTGIQILGGSSNHVVGNLIAANFGQGVDVLLGAKNNVIGGTAPADRNVISGCGGIGIFVRGAGTSGNLIQGNLIGTLPNGSAALANIHGVVIADGTTSNTIGGATPGAGNVISGNTGTGIGMQDAGTSGNQVQGNLIGTNATGDGALPNQQGIQIGFGASNNAVGGSQPGAGNVISANTFQGISLVSQTSGNQVTGNFIGTDVTGSLQLGNGGFAILVLSNANNNAVAGNVIAFTRVTESSSGDGVFVSTSTGDTILGNSIHDNAGLGIKLLGGNNSQAFPTLTRALVSPVNGNIALLGAQSSDAAFGPNEVQFFLADNDPSGRGEGKTFLFDLSGLPAGTTSFTTPAFTPPVPVAVGNLLTATATTAAGTSEFSQNVAVVANAVPIANAGADQTVAVGFGATLNGGGSHDPDLGPVTSLRYTWTQISGPSVTLSNPTSAFPSFSVAVPGKYVFSLVVFDGLDSSTNPAVVTVATRPQLTVTKVVVNDNGGFRFASSFPLLVDDHSVISGFVSNLDAGVHTVSETSSPGYAATISGECSAAGSISLSLADFKSCTITNNDIPPIYLHGTSANPATLSLDATAPTGTVAKFKDSPGVASTGGNPWKEIGTWKASSALFTGAVVGFDDLHVFAGLKNTDDEGTRFDVRAEVYIYRTSTNTSTLLSTGQTLCVTGVTRNPDFAKEVVVSIPAIPAIPDFAAKTFGADDRLWLKVLTRIGTAAGGSSCSGHGSAIGLRLYFDAVSRPARLARPAELGSDWNTGVGGNSSRTSLSRSVGPTASSILWHGGLPGFGQQSVIEGSILVSTRTAGGPDDWWIVAQNLGTGDELWRARLPISSPNPIAGHVSAIRGGQVYAKRDGSGGIEPQYLYALRATDGAILWRSEALLNIEDYSESLTFAANDDPIVGNWSSLTRINHVNGKTVWDTARQCIAGGGCMATVFGEHVYAWDLVDSEVVVSVFDAATGLRLYTSDPVPASGQNGLFVGPGGIVYVPESSDALAALQDTGSALVEKWRVPIPYTVFASFGIGPDGSVYSYSRSDQVLRLDPSTGAVRNTSIALPFFPGNLYGPRLAIDSAGKVFLTAETTGGGMIYSFDADLTLRWSDSVPNVNLGGPALGRDGTLVVCGDEIRAYKTP